MDVIDVSNVKNWSNLIIVVSRKCAKWEKAGRVTVKVNSEDIIIEAYRWKDAALFGFEENKNAPLFQKPRLTLEAIKMLLTRLKTNLRDTQNIFLVVHDVELGFGSNVNVEDLIKFNDKTTLRIANSGILQECLAVLKPDGEISGVENWGLYLNYLSTETKINKTHWELWGFVHDEDSEIYKCLIEEYSSNIYESLINHGLKKNIIKPLSILKHRIAHLFLSVDIDLQGIEEVLRQGREDDAKGYFGKAFSEKKLNEKLEKAEKLVNGDSEAPDKLLKEGVKGIVDVKNIKDEKKKEDVRKILDKIDALFKNSDIQELAVIIEKADKNGNGFGNFKEYLDKVKKGQKKSFNDWLCALDDCLDRLREAISN